MEIKIIEQKKKGLFPFSNDKKKDPYMAGPYSGIKLSQKATRQLEAAGAIIKYGSTNLPSGAGAYTVYLSRVPKNLVVVKTFDYQYWLLGIRTLKDPPFHNERDPDFLDIINFTPCPKCGYALLWYGAGYRICCGQEHHYWQVNER